ncbi:MAG TPA: CBS domain-containing protein [Armatimonadota bacterium]|nr:CBS domain-containing protein [Armatimonadota bacterium]
MATDATQPEWEERLRTALERQDRAALTALLAEIHPADLADFFTELEEPEQIALLESLTDEQAAELLAELEPAGHIVGVAQQLRHVVGGLMAKEYVRVTPDETVAETLALLRGPYADAEMIYEIYVVDEDERLLGVVTLRHLIAHAPDAVMSDIMAREYVSVPTDMPRDDVADVVRRHDLLAVPVLDEDGRMQGIVTVDDVSEAMREEATEDLLAVSGGEEAAEEPRPWSRRPGWRTGLLTLAGATLLAGLIWLFARELTAWHTTAALLPLLLALGLSAGSQAALGMDHAYEDAIERRQLGRIFLREVAAGGGLALISGALAGLVLFVMTRSPARAGGVALPFVVSLWTASLIGALGTVVVRKRRDALSAPAHAAIVTVALIAAVAVNLWLARFGLPR